MILSGKWQIITGLKQTRSDHSHRLTYFIQCVDLRSDPSCVSQLNIFEPWRWALTSVTKGKTAFLSIIIIIIVVVVLAIIVIVVVIMIIIIKVYCFASGETEIIAWSWWVWAVTHIISVLITHSGYISHLKILECSVKTPQPCLYLFTIGTIRHIPLRSVSQN